MQVLKKNIISNAEISVLQALVTAGGLSVKDMTTINVEQIAIGAGLKDNDEVLRALYTLEGKSLVEPDPPGDFTSQNWKITTHGEKALSLIRIHG